MFNHQNLGFFGQAGDLRLWGYDTTDSPAEISKFGYFNKASRQLRPGHIMFLRCVHDGKMACGMFLITKVEEGDVHISDFTTWPAEIEQAPAKQEDKDAA